MKKLVVMIFILATFSVFGATSTLAIQGNVSGVLSITSPPSLVLDIDPLVNTSQDSQEITITERSNNKTGYEVTISTENDFNLVQGSDSIPYDFVYGGVSYTTPTGSVLVTDSSEKTIGLGTERIFKIEVLTDFPVSGTYTDNLTFTIMNK